MLDDRILTQEQINTLENTDVLMPNDIEAVKAYVEYISDIEKQYGNDVPLDVDEALTRDLERIVNILRNNLNKKGVYPSK